MNNHHFISLLVVHILFVVPLILVQCECLEIPHFGNCSFEWNRFSETQRKEGLVVEESRVGTFCENLETIKNFNKDQAEKLGYFLSIGPFASHTHEEMQAMLMSTKLPKRRNETRMLQTQGKITAESVDWRSHMPAIKNQGACGSCWAFAAIDVVDFGSGASHSEQQILDCGVSAGTCSGGYPEKALEFLASSGGSIKESDYPYVGSVGECRSQGMVPSATVSNVFVTSSGESGIADSVQSEVLAVCIVGGANLQHYGGGIWSTSCGNEGGHCIGVVGYNSVGEYWILRNSWGASWGIKGYFYFKAGIDLCSIGTNGGVGAAISSGPSPSPPPSPTPTPTPSTGTCAAFQTQGYSICSCTTGCGSSTSPCACQNGTNCQGFHDGCKCCTWPLCSNWPSASICQCTRGCDGPCACAAGTDCTKSFSNCHCCEKDSEKEKSRSHYDAGETWPFLSASNPGYGSGGSGSGGGESD